MNAQLPHTALKIYSICSISCCLAFLFFFSFFFLAKKILSFPEISFENCHSVSTNVNFSKASFTTDWEFGFFSRGTVSTFESRSVWQMNAQFHRCTIAVMARLKPCTVLILSPNSEKWIGVVSKVKGLHFIDLLEFILFFFLALLLHPWHTQTHKLL